MYSSSFTVIYFSPALDTCSGLSPFLSLLRPGCWNLVAGCCAVIAPNQAMAMEAMRKQQAAFAMHTGLEDFDDSDQEDEAKTERDPTTAQV